MFGALPGQSIIPTLASQFLTSFARAGSAGPPSCLNRISVLADNCRPVLHVPGPFPVRLNLGHAKILAFLAFSIRNQFHPSPRIRMPRKSLYVSLFLFILLCQHFQTSLFKSESADSAVKVWVNNPLNHVWQDTPPGTVTTIEIAGARNEVESFQVTISSPVRKLEGVSASVSDLDDGRGNRISQSHIQLYRQEYVYVRNPSPHSKDPPGWWPDPLVPVANPYDGRPVSAMRLTREEERGQVSYKLSGARFPGNNFTVWPQKNQPLWADVSIPSDAIAGNYSGKFSITLAETGRIELPITLTVWNFSLPSGPPLTTQFGGLDGVAAKHGVAEGSSEALELEERYAAALEAHRIAAPIPSSLYPPIRRNGAVDWKKTHEALKRYLNSHRTGPFRIPDFPAPELQGKGKKLLIRYLQNYFAYLKANGWATRRLLCPCAGTQ